MARQLKEEVTCDAPGRHEGVADACEVTLSDGRTYEPDWCQGHQDQIRKMLGSVKPKPGRRRGRMVPVDPNKIPRVPAKKR